MDSRSWIEKFKDITAGLQSVAIIVVAIVGGIWTFYVFHIFAQKEKAQSELEDLKRKLQLIVIEVQLEAKQHRIANDKNRYIQVRADLANKGNLRTTLLLSDSLTLMRAKIGKEIELDPDSLRKFSVVSSRKENNFRAYGLVMRAGETQRIPFLLKVDDPGIYYLDFLVPVDENDPSIAHFPKEHRPVFWGSSTYVAVD
jgi:hypothetical protein